MKNISAKQFNFIDDTPNAEIFFFLFTCKIFCSFLLDTLKMLYFIILIVEHINLFDFCLILYNFLSPGEAKIASL